jgi:transcriptional regulator with GAF, ATPase, and Fis domain
MARRDPSDFNPGNGAGIWAAGAPRHGDAAVAFAASIVEPTNDRPLLDGSPQMRAIVTVIENVADTDATVLIRGESGVGKDLVARAVHAASSRCRGPFVKVNCAAIPLGLLESELFGHERGAFTGAHQRKHGQFEYANRGTIYLDELAELPLALQAKLLHVLQDFQFSRVGGLELLQVDTRVVAATNRNLEAAMARGEFREDLYYRLNVVEINVIRRLAVLGDGDQTMEALMSRNRNGHNGYHGHNGHVPVPSPIAGEGLREAGRRGARDAERTALLEVLDRVSWNRTEAARILKVSYKTLLKKISERGLTPPLCR